MLILQQTKTRESFTTYRPPFTFFHTTYSDPYDRQQRRHLFHLTFHGQSLQEAWEDICSRYQHFFPLMNLDHRTNLS